MENLPILQDYAPYWGCCPATAKLPLEYSINWGKGTADRMMPLGDWFTTFALAYKCGKSETTEGQA